MNRLIPQNPQEPLSEVADSDVGKHWESFVNSSSDLQIQANHPIYQSWLRCKKSRVDPYLSRSPILLPKERTARLCDESDLLRAALPVLNEVAPIMMEAGQVLALANEEGTLLKVYARTDAWDGLQEIRYIPGANWSEEVTGTSGCGTALKTLHPMHIVRSEHFCKSWHSWVCSAAPIFDPKTRRPVGVLEASVAGALSGPCSLAAVVAMATAIEGQLEILQGMRDQHTIERYHDIASVFSQNAVLALDSHSEIIKFNQRAISLLGIDGRLGSSALLERVFGSNDHARVLATLAERNDVFELPLINDGRYWLTCHPISLGSKRVGSVVVLDARRSKSKTGRKSENGTARYAFEDIIGRSKALLESISVARIAALNKLPVLISGESGTGKEMIAEGIHQASSRSVGPFVAVNCAAIPSELMSSELFGYAEGAYTGAKRNGNAGKFEAAEGGTLFLDEISDLSRNAQAALLRVLQEMEVTRLGSHRSVPLDVRVIAASNADLHRMAAEKTFRGDLLHRLNVLSIDVPPLRDRLEDVELLAKTFLEAAALQLGKSELHFDRSVIDCFLQYHWPGNVRELKNVIHRAVALSTRQVITLKELPSHLVVMFPTLNRGEESSPIQKQERRMILDTLAACRGNFSQAASQLGVGRTTLYRKLKKYGIQRSWKPGSR